MAQAGLHVPATVAKLPVFRSVFADIGDEQSIEASLSTFSSHIRNLVAMDRDLQLPALVLLDEVGTGTDPNEGGALATAIVQHFRQRGALIIATTHFDAVKTWGIGTEGVAVAAFAFDPQNFAPTYRLLYGAPGRSLAIEMAQRLGMPASVITAARGYLSDDQKRLQAHLSRLDAQARALESDRVKLERERRAFNETNAELSKREKSLAEREEVFKKRLNERLDERLRQAQARRRCGDRAAEGKIGSDRGEGVAARGDQHRRNRIGARRSARGDRSHRRGSASSGGRRRLPPGAEAARSARRRSRKSDRRSPSADWDSKASSSRSTATARKSTCAESASRPRSRSCASSAVRLRNRHAREGSRQRRSEAARRHAQRVERDRHDGRSGRRSRLAFLDDTLVTDLHEVRIVHGHGTGQLRKGIAAFLKTHPQVEKYYAAPENQGGGGATIVELKE